MNGTTQRAGGSRNYKRKFYLQLEPVWDRVVKFADGTTVSEFEAVKEVGKFRIDKIEQHYGRGEATIEYKLSDAERKDSLTTPWDYDFYSYYTPKDSHGNKVKGKGHTYRVCLEENGVNARKFNVGGFLTHVSVEEMELNGGKKMQYLKLIIEDTDGEYHIRVNNPYTQNESVSNTAFKIAMSLVNREGTDGGLGYLILRPSMDINSSAKVGNKWYNYKDLVEQFGSFDVDAIKAKWPDADVRKSYNGTLIFANIVNWKEEVVGKSGDEVLAMVEGERGRFLEEYGTVWGLDPKTDVPPKTIMDKKRKRANLDYLDFFDKGYEDENGTFHKGLIAMIQEEIEKYKPTYDFSHGTDNAPAPPAPKQEAAKVNSGNAPMPPAPKQAAATSSDNTEISDQEDDDDVPF